MKPATILSEEILRLLSKTQGLTAGEIAKETKTNEKDARVVIEALMAAGLIIANGETLIIDPAMRDLVPPKE